MDATDEKIERLVRSVLDAVDARLVTVREEIRALADEMEARLKAREEDLARQRALSAKPPVLIGAALVLPIGLIRQAAGQATVEVSQDGDTQVIELHVAEDDMGKVIGRNGSVAKALRTLLKVTSARTGEPVSLEIV